MSLSMDVARVSTRPDNNVMGETSNILLHFVYDLLRLKSIRYFFVSFKRECQDGYQEKYRVKFKNGSFLFAGLFGGKCARNK